MTKINIIGAYEGTLWSNVVPQIGGYVFLSKDRRWKVIGVDYLLTTCDGLSEEYGLNLKEVYVYVESVLQFV